MIKYVFLDTAIKTFNLLKKQGHVRKSKVLCCHITRKSVGFLTKLAFCGFKIIDLIADLNLAIFARSWYVSMYSPLSGTFSLFYAAQDFTHNKTIVKSRFYYENPQTVDENHPDDDEQASSIYWMRTWNALKTLFDMSGID